MNKIKRYLPRGIFLLVTIAFLSAMSLVNWSLRDLFITPDQRGRILMEKKDFAGAAAVFHDPMQRGTALYMSGNFKEAAATFAQENSIKALYNRANSLLMAGEYEDAISTYEKVLASQPDWLAARENLALTRARKEKMKSSDDDHGGTGGMLEADEIVFTEMAQSSPNQEQVTGNEKQSDQEMRAMWLRRVETRPADFLRAKFAYQKAFGQRDKTPKKSKGKD